MHFHQMTADDEEMEEKEERKFVNSSNLNQNDINNFITDIDANIGFYTIFFVKKIPHARLFQLKQQKRYIINFCKIVNYLILIG